jgi:hypothetical protein
MNNDSSANEEETRYNALSIFTIGNEIKFHWKINWKLGKLALITK